MSLRKKMMVTGVVLATLSAALAVAAGVYFWSVAREVPDIGKVTDYRAELPLRIYDRNGRLMHTYALERRELVPFEQMPEHLKNAFLAAEDADFYKHSGFDPLAIVRSVLRGVVNLRVRGGGSTITQQLAKNLFLSPERSIKRKILELVLARRLESALSKDEILFLYLNEIYLGRGAHGVQSAARAYYGKSVSEVTLAEAAILAGLPQRPGEYAPNVNPAAARRRQLYALGQMRDHDFITAAQYDQAITEVVHIVSDYREPAAAPYVAEMARQWAIERYGEEAALTDGLHIWTTVDYDAIQAAEKAIRFGTWEIERANGYGGAVTHLNDAQAIDSFADAEWRRAVKRWRARTQRYVAAVPPTAWQDVSLPSGYAGLITVAGDQELSAVVVELYRDIRAVAVQYGPYRGLLAQPMTRLASSPEFPDKAARYGEPAALDNPARSFKVGDVIVGRIVSAPKAEGQIKTALSYLKAKQKEPQFWLQLADKPVVQSSLISVEPHSGDILALVGGRNFYDSQYNRVLQAKRQIGSTFKPFVYSAALEHGFTITTTVRDDRVRFDNADDGSVWRPQNFEEDDAVRGEPVTILDAVTRSRNIITIQVANEVGIGTLLDYARRFGLQGPLPRNLSVALGSEGITAWELARAYSAFGAHGKLAPLHFVHEVRTSAGEIIYTAPRVSGAVTPWPYEDRMPAPTGIEKDFASHPELPRDVSSPEADRPQAISATTAYIMNNVLKSVVQRGTAVAAATMGRPLAGKTGTTNDNVDSWFAGMSAQLVTVVWVGYDDIQPIGYMMTGSRAALPIWMDYMSAVHEGIAVEDFPIPPGITMRKIDPHSGGLADITSTRTWMGAFVVGTEPTEAKQAAAEEQKQAEQQDMQLLNELQ